jgi:hypothetical protein
VYTRLAPRCVSRIAFFGITFADGACRRPPGARGIAVGRVAYPRAVGRVAYSVAARALCVAYARGGAPGECPTAGASVGRVAYPVET